MAIYSNVSAALEQERLRDGWWRWYVISSHGYRIAFRGFDRLRYRDDVHDLIVDYVHVPLERVLDDLDVAKSCRLRDIELGEEDVRLIESRIVRALAFRGFKVNLAAKAASRNRRGGS